MNPAELATLDAVCFPRKQQWSHTLWAGELIASDRVLLDERRDGTLIGVVSVQVVADTADLLRIMVDPSCRGAGVATGLLHRAIAVAAERGATRMLLEVQQDNAAAFALYERAGFVPIAERRDYYGPGLHATVMEADLPAPPSSLLRVPD